MSDERPERGQQELPGDGAPGDAFDVVGERKQVMDTVITEPVDHLPAFRCSTHQTTLAQTSEVIRSV